MAKRYSLQILDLLLFLSLSPYLPSFLPSSPSDNHRAIIDNGRLERTGWNGLKKKKKKNGKNDNKTQCQYSNVRFPSDSSGSLKILQVDFTCAGWFVRRKYWREVALLNGRTRPKKRRRGGEGGGGERGEGKALYRRKRGFRICRTVSTHCIVYVQYKRTDE